MYFDLAYDRLHISEDHKFAAAFNIGTTNVSLIRIIREALAHCCGLQLTDISYNLTSDSFQQMADGWFDHLEFIMYLESHLDVIVKEHKNIIFAYPNPSGFFSASFVFIFIGDWIHWLIYVYLNNSIIHINFTGQDVSGSKFLRDYLESLCPKKTYNHESSNKENQDNFPFTNDVYTNNIHSKFLPLFRAIRKSLGRCLGMTEDLLTWDFPLVMLNQYSKNQGLTEKKFGIEVEKNLGITIKFNHKLAFISPVPEIFFTSVSIYITLFDWVYYCIFNNIKYAEIEDSHGCSFSGRSYLDSFMNLESIRIKID